MTNDELAIAEAAACLWEAVMTGASHPRREAHGKRLGQLWTDIGTAELRSRVISGALDCHEAYVKACAKDQYDAPFDWDWCPAYLEKHFDAIKGQWKPKVTPWVECPKCGDIEAVEIQGTAWLQALYNPEGHPETEQVGDWNYHPASNARCTACYHKGFLAEFEAAAKA